MDKMKKQQMQTDDMDEMIEKNKNTMKDNPTKEDSMT